MLMKIESWKNKTASATKILVALAVLLSALTFLKIGSFVSSSEAGALPAELDPARAGASDLKKLLAETRASADAIKKKNLFVPPTARQHPVREVAGILGQETLIGDKWYKVGDRVGEARIVAIEPTKVKIAWEGQEKEFSPIGATGSAGGPAGRAASGGPRPGPAAAAKAVIANSGRGPGVSATAVSDQEKEKKRERWANASPEEKQRFKEEARQRSGRKNR
jgi:hypothetical protein